MSSSLWDGFSGLWATPTLWSAGVPVGTMTADFGGSSADSVTFNSTDSLAGIMATDSLVTFDMAGGLLLAASFAWAGAVTQTGGTLGLAGTDPVVSGALLQTGGTLMLSSAMGFAASLARGITQGSAGALDILAGTLSLRGTSALDGTIAGAGTLFVGGADAATFGADAVVAVRHIDIAAGAVLAFATGATGYDVLGDLVLESGAVLNAPGATITLAADGMGDLAGSVTLGQLAIAGAYDLGGLSLGGGSVLDVTGIAALDANPVALGTAGQLLVAAGGVLDLVAPGTLAGSGAAGVTIGGMVQDLAASFVVAVPTLVLAGALDLDGVLALTGGQAALGGTLAGAGTLLLGAGEAAQLGGAVLDQAGLSIAAGGTLAVTAASGFDGALFANGVLAIGAPFTLGAASTGTLAGTLTGGGTLVLDGTLADAATLIGASLLISGTAFAAPGAAVAAGGAITVATGGTLDLTGDPALTAARLVNAGLIYTGGPAVLAGSLFTTGTIDIGSGVLLLGAGTDTLGGVVAGAGTLGIGGLVSLATGITLNQAGLALENGTLALGTSLNYAGTLSGTGTLATNGDVLALQGGQFAGLVTGGGTLITAGGATVGGGPVDEGAGHAITLQGSGTTLLDSVAFTADGAGLTIGTASDMASLQVAFGAQFDITDAAMITSAETNTAALVNAGTIAVQLPDPLGAAVRIAVPTLLNTGTIDDAAGALSLIGAVTNNGEIDAYDIISLTGPLSGAGALTIGVDATASLSGLVGGGQIIDFGGGDGVLTLGNGGGFAGTIEGFAPGDVIDFLGQTPATLSYAGGTLSLLSVMNGITAAVAQFAAPGLAAASLALVADGAGGTLLLAAPAALSAPVATIASRGTWNAPETGLASTGSNWLGGSTPAAGALLILPASTNLYEAVFNESFTGYGLTAGTGATLAVTGGELVLRNTLNVAGPAIVTGGTLEAVANGGNIIGTLSLGAAGALQADTGTLTIGTGLNALAGTLEGAGAIDITGAVTLGPSADLVVGTLELAGTTSLGGNLFYLGDAFSNTGQLNLGADNLLLGFFAVSNLAGLVTGTGTLTDAGFADLDGTLAATLLIVGEAQGAGPESLTGTISVAAGALLSDPTITGTTGTLINAGTIMAGAGVQSLGLGALMETGNIVLGPGTLAINAGHATLGGGVTGPGTLALTGGQVSVAPGLALSSVLELAGATLNVGTLSLASAFEETAGLLQAGALTLGAANNSLAGFLAGTVTMAGGVLGGLALTGAGTVLTLEGPTRLAAGLSLASGTALDVAATLALAGPITGAGTLVNAGLLFDDALAAVSLAAGLWLQTGTLAIAAGSLAINAGGTLGGAVIGGGALLLQNTAPLTLAAGLALSGTALTLGSGGFVLGGGQSDAGLFDLAGGTVSLAGQSLTLAGAGSLAGSFAGTGGVTLGGAFTAGALGLAAGTTLDIAGALLAQGALTAGMITIGPAGTLDITGNAATGMVVNTGLIEKNAGPGSSTFSAAGLLNTGTIAAAFGTLAIASAVTNNGALVATGLGALSVASLAGTGTAIAGPAGLTVLGAVSAGQTIGFNGPGGRLTLDNAGAFAGTIAGALNGDIIDLPSLSAAGLTTQTLVGGVLTLASGNALVTLALGGAAAFTQPLLIGTDGGGGTQISMPCFAAGTAIATPQGPRRVETLRPGDLVLTADGTAAPITWTGRRRIALTHNPAAAGLRPVRIAAGAFGPGLPARDLRLSPNHAIATGGVLIQAALLVNGATVRREVATPVVTYHHIELARHSLLLAEDLAVESYRETGSRGSFAGHAGAAGAAQPPCLPLCAGGAALTDARARLLGQAGRLGFTRTAAPSLAAHGARRQRPIRRGSAWTFPLADGLSRITLLSPIACPAELSAGPADPRRLGAALAQVILRTPQRATMIDLRGAAHSGLYECEGERCWTNGQAHLSLPRFDGPGLLEVRLAGAVERWVGPA